MELLSDVLLNNQKNLWWFILNTIKILNNEYIKIISSAMILKYKHEQLAINRNKGNTW